VEALGVQASANLADREAAAVITIMAALELLGKEIMVETLPALQTLILIQAKEGAALERLGVKHLQQVRAVLVVLVQTHNLLGCLQYQAQ
jgi:hypothetical protein